MVTGKELPMDELKTEEEVRMSTPHSDRQAWRAILLGELQLGISRFQGPPGLLEEMENLLSSSTEQEITSMLLTHSIPIAKTKAG